MINLNQEFNLSELWQLFFKHKWLLFIWTLLGCVTAVCISLFLITPSYQMESQVIVVPSSETTNAGSEVQANLQMINTYKALIMSPKVLGRVSRDLDGQYSVRELKSMVQPTTEENSQVINIMVTTDSPKEAARIANTTAKEFIKVTPKMVSTSSLELLTLAETKTSEKPIFPNPLLFGFVGLIGGFFIGTIHLLFQTIFSSKMKREEDFEELGIPLLGSVGKIKVYEPRKRGWQDEDEKNR